MKILIAEDNISNKLLFKRVLKKHGFDILDADNGDEAFNIMLSDQVDVLITDWMMPKLDGIKLIQKVKAELKHPPIMIMVTAIASDEAKKKSIEAGAAAYMAKPINSSKLVETINSLLKNKGAVLPQKQLPSNLENKTGLKAVAFAASTGGPPTLTKIFSELHFFPRAVIFIVLHGPAWMLESFADKLNDLTPFDTVLGKEEMLIKPGTAYLAPGERHMVINKKRNRLHLLDSPPVNFVKPAADPLFESVADAYGCNSIGVVLTGMGKDGTVGAGYIKAAGGKVLAQDPETAILHAMPRSVIEMGIADKVVSVENIAEQINKLAE